MITLAGFAPFQPTPGLALWSSIIFILFWWLMSKYAFGPIARGLSKREAHIKDALEEAEKAREEMSKLKAENEQILAEAREERATMLKEAKEAKNSIIAEAKEKAKEEATRISMTAKQEIENEKQAAITEVKNKVGIMATEIAEKIIKKELSGQSDHESFVNTLVNDIKLN
jgi:F-type H+-transporting ATPase subunit b